MSPPKQPINFDQKQNSSAFAVELLSCGNKKLDLSQPQIMGVINVTPDSRFGSDTFGNSEQILQRAHQMIEDGAAIIDVGGESTRPGSDFVSAQEEIDRIMPIIEKLISDDVAIISVDTRKPEVMKVVLQQGVHMINDVTALKGQGTLELLAKNNCAICLMHMQGEPATMQIDPQYDNVVQEVKNFLTDRVKCCLESGIAKNRLVIDPGFGFGKTLQHNLQLLKQLKHFQSLELPILAGFSRKSMIEQMIGVPVEERLFASIALATLATEKGTKIIRTHDVKPTMQAIKIATHVQQEG